MSRRSLPAVTALLLTLGLAPSGLAATAGECDADPRRRQLDFWVGEWRLVGEDGRLQGTHQVQKGEGGCVIEERWESSRDSTGRSLSYFDPALGRWRHSRVDDRGRVAHYEGELRNGAMHFEGTRSEADGSSRRARVVLTPRPGPAVDQRIELSGEAETTWSLHFAGTYVPVGQPLPATAEAEAASPPSEAAAESVPPTEAAPAPAVPTAAPAPAEAPAAAEAAAPVEAPAPAEAIAPEEAAASAAAASADETGPEPTVEPAPAPPATVPAVGHGSVRPQTGMVTAEALAQGRAQVPMASPMVLRVPVGRVDRLRPGYAWTTREVARYECEGTTIQAIRVSKGRSKAGRQPIEVTLRLTSNRRLARVELGVALLAGEERLAAATLPAASAGVGIPAQIQHGAVEHTLVLQLEKRQLAELFGDGRRPELEVTLRHLRKGD